MNEDVCDAGIAFLDRRLHSVRDFVALVDGNVSVHSDV
jgi:hypothetical protein